MAHTDACKYQVCQLVERLVKNGQSVNEASKHVQVESDGIPAETIRRWWRQIQEEAKGLVKNDQQPETPATTPQSVATSGYKTKPQEVAKRVETLVEKGASVREAAKTVAEETGKTPSSVRQAYAREKDKVPVEDAASEAWQFAEIAISQLKRIRKNDPGRPAAFQKVKDWIASQEEK
jgi:transposase-like protein